MKRILFQPAAVIILVVAGLFFSNTVNAQTDVLTFDYTGNTTFSACNGDNTYTSGTSGTESLSGTNISLGATVNSIGFETHFGRSGSGNTTVSFYLNSHFIGSLTDNGSCNDRTISSIDPSFFDADGPNTISYTATSTSTRVYNVALTINYTACTAPQAPDVPDEPIKYCMNDNATALTATGDDLLWYSSPDDASGSTDAPIPSTDDAGTTAYYVTQTVGCESDKAEIDVTVNALPTTQVVGFTNVTCNGGSDGTLTVQGVGGTGAFKYSIDEGAHWTSTFISDSYEFMGLNAQAYKILVKDENECVSKPVQ